MTRVTLFSDSSSSCHTLHRIELRYGNHNHFNLKATKESIPMGRLSLELRQPSGITLDTALLHAAQQEEDQHHHATAAEGCPHQPNTSMFANQDKLPRMPIPTLGQTMKKFLDFCEAHLSDEEDKQELHQEINQFCKSDGLKLQELLIEYEDQAVDPSCGSDGLTVESLGCFYEEFWSEHLLYSTNKEVQPWNPFFVWQDDPDASKMTLIRRGASICFQALRLASAIRDETFSPDYLHEQPLCMDQYKAVFGCARIPSQEEVPGGGGADLDLYPNSTHIVVLYQQQVFYFQGLWEDGTVAVDEQDIAGILSLIQQHAGASAEEATTVETAHSAFPGVLTTLPHNEWASYRELLASVENNAEYLCLVESALFVLVLDDYVPKDVEDAASCFLHGSYELSSASSKSKPQQQGTCLNRWYDKLQFIILRDGTACTNFEDSSIDGHTALRVVSDIYAQTVVDYASSILSKTQVQLPSVIQARLQRAATTLDDYGQPTIDVFPKKLCFAITPALESAIYYAETRLGDAIHSYSTCILNFDEYGKNLLTQEYKVSPDAYVQLAFQLAHFKLYGSICNAYETVVTKKYFHGRTEAMRPATIEARNACKLFFDDTIPVTQKRLALQQAVRAHTKHVKDCTRGKGADRHLHALKCMAERTKMEIPDFYSSKAWKLLQRNILTTSNCGNPALRLYSLGPSEPDGYGIGYIIKDQSISFSICSKHRQTDRFRFALETVLCEMETVLRSAAQLSSTLEDNESLEARARFGLSRFRNRRGSNNLRASIPSSTDLAYRDIYGEDSVSEQPPPPPPDASASSTLPPKRKSEAARRWMQKKKETEFINGSDHTSKKSALTGDSTPTIHNRKVAGDSRGPVSVLADTQNSTPPPPPPSPPTGEDHRPRYVEPITYPGDTNTTTSKNMSPAPKYAAPGMQQEDSLSETNFNQRPYNHQSSASSSFNRNQESGIISNSRTYHRQSSAPPSFNRPSEDKVPGKPTRRGSMFSGVRRRESMGNSRLHQTGMSLENSGLNNSASITSPSGNSENILLVRDQSLRLDGLDVNSSTQYASTVNVDNQGSLLHMSGVTIGSGLATDPRTFLSSQRQASTNSAFHISAITLGSDFGDDPNEENDGEEVTMDSNRLHPAALRRQDVRTKKASIDHSIGTFGSAEVETDDDGGGDILLASTAEPSSKKERPIGNHGESTGEFTAFTAASTEEDELKDFDKSTDLDKVLSEDTDDDETGGEGRDAFEMEHSFIPSKAALMGESKLFGNASVDTFGDGFHPEHSMQKVPSVRGTGLSSAELLGDASVDTFGNLIIKEEESSISSTPKADSN